MYTVAAGPSGKAAAAKIGLGKAKKLNKGFDKLLACGGVWEAAKGRGRAVTNAPHWIWEGLASYDPDAAELAVEAADMASTARYFTVPLPAITHFHSFAFLPSVCMPLPSWDGYSVFVHDLSD